MKGTYRHEFKYNISYADYQILKPRLNSIMQRDPHTKADGLYEIHSIYFDNYNDKALREKINGVQKREKYRIRWYNDSEDVMILEKKTKINSLCMKFGVKISRSQFLQILDGDYDWMLKSDNDILQEFYYRLKQQQLFPCVQVSYIREPYIYISGNVRITFDSRIQSSLYRRNWGYELPAIAATDNPEQIVMEVKYDSYLPEVIAQILQLGDIRQNAFSKYAICRRFG